MLLRAQNVIYRLIGPTTRTVVSKGQLQLTPNAKSRTMASSTLPKTMTGVIIEKTGGTEVLQYKTDLPVPEPAEDRILIKNEYIGINFIDT